MPVLRVGQSDGTRLVINVVGVSEVGSHTDLERDVLNDWIAESPTTFITSECRQIANS